jgi:hypothetical protein
MAALMARSWTRKSMGVLSSVAGVVAVGKPPNQGPARCPRHAPRMLNVNVNVNVNGRHVEPKQDDVPRGQWWRPVSRQTVRQAVNEIGV